MNHPSFGASGPFFFGVGRGRLTPADVRRRQKAAAKHGASFVFVHGNQGHCVCGWGCRLDTCPVLSYHFSAPNHGEPFNSAVRRAVESEL